MTNQFVLELATDVERCQECKQLPGEYVHVSTLGLERTVVCAGCGAKAVATLGGKLEVNTDRDSDYHHHYKADEATSTSTEIHQSAVYKFQGYSCPNCEETWEGNPPPLESGWRVAEIQSNLLDDDYDTYLVKNKEDLDWEHFTFWKCPNGCILDTDNWDEDQIPKEAVAIWACGYCDGLTDEEETAQRCCRYYKEREWR